MTSRGEFGEMKIWDITGEEILTVDEPTGLARGAFSPDGQLIALATADDQVLVLDLTTGKKVLTIPRPKNIYRNLSVGPEYTLSQK